MNTENHYVETDLGNVSPNPRGNYDAEESYEYLDLVNLDGGSYLCLAPLGGKITGISPEPGKTTENWQCLVLPGGMTPEYIAMHDRVENLAEQVKENAGIVQTAEENVSGMEENVKSLQAQVAKDAEEAEESKDSAAGYAQAAETARKAAETAEDNINLQVTGFDAYVAQKTEEAEEDIDTARKTAVGAITTQQAQSVQAVKDQTAAYIAEAEENAEQSIQKIVDDLELDVEGIVGQVTAEGTKQIGLVESAGTTQTQAVNSAGATQKEAVETAGAAQKSAVETAGATQKTAVETAGTTQVQAVNSAGAAQKAAVEQEGETQVANVQAAAAEIIADREQIAENTAEIEKKINKDDAMSWAQWFDSHRTGWHGGVTFSQYDKSQSVLGTRTGDNEDVVIETSTNTTKGRNDFADNPVTDLMFNGIEVNGYIDEDGDPHINAVKGSPEFSRDGSNGDVYMAYLTPFYKRIYDENADGWDFADHKEEGLEPWDGAVRPDGTWRSFYFMAKYTGVNNDDGIVASISGRKPLRNTSHNNQITSFAAKGPQYCGFTSTDVAWAQWMMDMKFATRHSQSKLAGATSYYLQYPATVVEEDVKRIIIAKSQAANLIVGSYASIGYGAVSSGSVSLDRGNANLHAYADDVKILSIEDYDENNSAVYVDADAAFSTANVSLNGELSSPVYISTMHWWSGSCDDVQGPDGSPSNCTNGKEPYILSGVEFGHGGYIVIADIILNGVYDAEGDTYSQTPYIVNDNRDIATSITDDYVQIGYTLPDTNNAWKYISKQGYDSRYPWLALPIAADASSSTGYADGVHTGSRSTALREWLWFGNLYAGAFGGLRCVNAGAGLTNAWWDLLRRLSSLRRGVAA